MTVLGTAPPRRAREPEATFSRAPVGEAREDLPRILSFREDILHLAKEHGLDPAIIAGIISRETRGKNVVGDHGHGHGLMQIDDRYFTEWCAGWLAAGKPPVSGIAKGCEVLRGKRRALATLLGQEAWAKLPELPDCNNGVWSRDTSRVSAALAAYNSGEGNVRKQIRDGLDVDGRTTGKDYARDVLTRADVFRQNGF